MTSWIYFKNIISDTENNNSIVENERLDIHEWTFLNIYSLYDNHIMPVTGVLWNQVYMLI